MQMNRGASLTVRLTENPGYSEFTPQGKINPRLFNHWFHFRTEQWGMQVSVSKADYENIDRQFIVVIYIYISLQTGSPYGFFQDLL